MSPVLTGLSSPLRVAQALIIYFKEAEKIITAVIPHLGAPSRLLPLGLQHYSPLWPGKRQEPQIVQGVLGNLE